MKKVSLAIDMRKFNQGESSNADLACEKIALCLSFHKMKVDTVVVCADAVISSNGNEPIDKRLFIFILTKVLGDDFFLKKAEYRHEEIIDILDDLKNFGIFERRTDSTLLSFSKGLNTNLLIKNCLCSCRKLIADNKDELDEWLFHVCQQYDKCIKSDKFKKMIAEHDER